MKGLYYIYVAKTKALISCTVTAQQLLICIFFPHMQIAGFPMTQLNYNNNENGSVQKTEVYMSSVMTKPGFCICENKGADQLSRRRNWAADQHLCFS